MSDECANPLLLSWIKEWLDEAQQRNSKGVTVSESLSNRSTDLADVTLVTRKPTVR